MGLCFVHDQVAEVPGDEEHAHVSQKPCAPVLSSAVAAAAAKIAVHVNVARSDRVVISAQECSNPLSGCVARRAVTRDESVYLSLVLRSLRRPL